MPFEPAGEQVADDAASVPAGSSASVAGTAWPFVLAVYVAGVLFFLVRWLGGIVQLRRLLQHTEPAPPHLCELLGVASGHGPRLLVSRRLHVPISCGVWRPTVVLPADLCQGKANARLSWVLAHELTHIERRDALSGVLFALGQAVFFHLPWFWNLKKQVRLCQEYVADAAAVAERPAEDYAEFLLTFSETRPLPLGATGVSGPVSDLFRRVTMLLQNPFRVEKRCPRLWTCGLAGVLLALAGLLGGIGLRAEAGDTIVIIIPGQKSEESGKDKKAKQASGAGLNRVDVVNVKVATRDDKGNVVEKVVTLDKDGKLIQRGDGAADVRVVVPDPSGSVRVWTLDKDGIAAGKEIRVRARPKDGVGEDKTIQVWALDKDDASSNRTIRVWAGDPKVTAGWGVKPLVNAFAVTQVDWKNLEQLLERLQKEPGKVNLEEIRKALEELRKVAPVARAWAGTDDKNLRARVIEASPETRGRFGIRFNVPSTEIREYLGLARDQGIVVTEVLPGTPAAKAGLKVRDIILKLNGAPVPSDENAALKLFNAVKDGASVDLTILRRGKEEVIKGLTPAAASPARYRAWVRTSNVDRTPDKGAVLSVRIDSGNFTARHREKGLSINIEGKIKGGQAADMKISVRDGKTEFVGTDPAAVPEQWRQRVNRLLELIRGDAGSRERKRSIE
jgi:beta-lactamase regulating signal transducer with metallopeptidase domain